MVGVQLSLKRQIFDPFDTRPIRNGRVFIHDQPGNDGNVIPCHGFSRDRLPEFVKVAVVVNDPGMIQADTSPYAPKRHGR